MSSAGVRSRTTTGLWYVSNWHRGGVLREAQDWFQAAPQSAPRRADARWSLCTRYRIRPQKILRFPSLRIGPSLLQLNL
jgi:hypothetical protein